MLFNTQTKKYVALACKSNKGHSLIKNIAQTVVINIQCWLQLLNKQGLLYVTMVVSFAGRRCPGRDQSGPI